MVRVVVGCLISLVRSGLGGLSCLVMMENHVPGRSWPQVLNSLVRFCCCFFSFWAGCEVCGFAVFFVSLAFGAIWLHGEMVVGGEQKLRRIEMDVQVALHTHPDAAGAHTAGCGTGTKVAHLVEHDQVAAGLAKIPGWWWTSRTLARL